MLNSFPTVVNNLYLQFCLFYMLMLNFRSGSTFNDYYLEI